MEEWQNTSIIGAWILIAFVFIGLLVVSMILLVRLGFRKAERAQMEQQIQQLEYQQELLKAQINASEEEKQRIASDLHDHFGVSLSTLKMKVQQLYTAPADQQSGFLSGINQLLDKNIEDMRDLSHGIYPPMLKEWGIILALKEIAIDLAEKTKLRIVYTKQNLQADEWTTLQLFRICQEFIHNSVRHGKAEQVTIHFRIFNSNTVLLLSDNGCGFDPATLKKGTGLININKRCKAIEAKSRLRAAPGKGTTLLLVKQHA
ncbi:MAG: sensor histidine kinase [Bacteroidetes bacterium]|nr:sensor histidine kinase [Bacteroidota bacterium]